MYPPSLSIYNYINTMFEGASAPYEKPSRFVLRDGRYILAQFDSISSFANAKSRHYHVELYSGNGNQIFSIKFVDGLMTRLIDESLDGRYIIVVFATVSNWVSYSLYYTIDLEKRQAVKYDIRLTDPIKFDGLGNIVTFGGSIAKPGFRIIDPRDDSTPKFIPTPHRPNEHIACDGSLIAFSYVKEDRTYFALIDTMNDELTPLFDRIQTGKAFKIAFVTPSVIFARQYGSGAYFVYDILNKKLRVGVYRILMEEPNYTFSPDGRFLLYNWVGRIIVESIMDGEQTEFNVDPANRSRLEIQMSPRGEYIIYGGNKHTFDTPLPYPVYTIRHSAGWIRLMSNGTLETHETWPGPGLEVMAVRRELLKRGLSKDALTLPISIWMNRDKGKTFEEARGEYLVGLTRIIAKEIISK